MIKYTVPKNWIKYDNSEIQSALVEAESVILALKNIPYQREWVEKLQTIELKREVAGTSRIEGADFTESELDEALRDSPEELFTRSQKQARAAVNTYRWLANVPDERPIDSELIREIHKRIVTGADDDHCEPGALRKSDQNVNFGQPRHRGASGGSECEKAFYEFTDAIIGEFPKHNKIVQALAIHYHLAAMHPFLDGNGRTARAMEALMLQRSGLRDTCFIAMSNYYYDEKIAYLNALADSHQNGHNITPFLIFGLKGLSFQVQRLLKEIKIHVQKAVYRNVMYDLFGRLKTGRRRVIAERQLIILKMLLEKDKLELMILYEAVKANFANLKNPHKAYIRDLNGLLDLGAIKLNIVGDENLVFLLPRLEWPTEITESDFLKRVKTLPKAKTTKFI